MSLLLESIQILDGIPQRLNYHNDRLNRSRNLLMCSHTDIYLEDYLKIPQEFMQAQVKCRILYGQDIDDIEFAPYQPKRFTKFILQDTQIDYPLKLINRSAFQVLKDKLLPTEEIIFVKNGFITDTSFSNLVFKHNNGNWYTPEYPLLEGTQREYLLDEGIIEEVQIRPKDLKNYSHFKLINAMLNFDNFNEKYTISQIQH